MLIKRKKKFKLFRFGQIPDLRTASSELTISHSQNFAKTRINKLIPLNLASIINYMF